MSDENRDQPPGTGVADLERELAFLVRRLEAVQRHRSYPLKRAHYLLLLILERDGPQTAGHVAEELDLDASTVARQIAVMTDQGLVAKQADPSDARSGRLHATDRGLTRMAAMRTARLQRVDRLFADWPEDERRRLAMLLDRLNQSLAATLRY